MTALLSTELLWDLPRVGAPSADATGRVVVVPVTTTTREARSTVLWLLDTTGGAHRQLTADGATATSPRVAPDGHAVAFVRPVDGRPQVHVLPLDGGEARQVTELPLGVTGSATWVGTDRLLVVGDVLDADPDLAATAAWRDAADERVEVHATERRMNRAWDTHYDDALTEHTFLVDLTDPDAPPRDCTPGTWRLPDPLADPADHAAVSPDGRWLAVTTTDPRGEPEDRAPRMRCHVVDLEAPTPVMRPVTDVDRAAGPPRWLPDGRIVLTLRTDPFFYAAPQEVVEIDPALGVTVPLVLTADQVSAVSVAPDGAVVLALDERGRSVLAELRDGTVRPVTGATAGAPGDGGVVLPVATSAGVVALHSSLVAPPEVVLVADGELRVLTDFSRAPLAGMDLGRVEERTITGAMDDDVQVFVLHPPQAATAGADGPPPLVQLVHGGPHGVFGDTWHWRWNAARFAAEGWVAACVNFHGSTSFGHDFTASIHGDWGTAPAHDVLTATDDLVADGTVDGDRLAVAGGSYGGYLATWLVATSDRFHAAVAHAAVTDLAGMLASDWTSGLAEIFGAEPWTDPARVQQASPSWRWSGLSTPTLVTHGERDLRVPIDQGRALYGALQAKGVPSRLVVYPSENHWVLDRRRSEHWYGEVIGWLHRWLDA